jgi:hypothetical protein
MFLQKTYLPDTFSELLFCDDGDIRGVQNIGHLSQTDVAGCPIRFYHIEKQVQNILFALPHVMKTEQQTFS